MLNDACHYPPSLDAPDSVVLLLHGYGSNKDDLIGLAPELSRGLPNTLFLSVNAPQPAPNPGGYQWFPLPSMEPENMKIGTSQSAAHVKALLDEIQATYTLPADRIVLSGFSQGAMMSLFTGLTYDKTLAGVLAYSGTLLQDPKALKADAVQHPPIQLVHGDQDEVVPYAAMDYASENLDALGVAHATHTCYGLAHSIDMDGISVGRTFIEKALG